MSRGEGERDRSRLRPCREPNAGLDLGTPSSCPEPKPSPTLNRLRGPGAPGGLMGPSLCNPGRTALPRKERNPSKSGRVQAADTHLAREEDRALYLLGNDVVGLPAAARLHKAVRHLDPGVRAPPSDEILGGIRDFLCQAEGTVNRDGGPETGCSPGQEHTQSRRLWKRSPFLEAVTRRLPVRLCPPSPQAPGLCGVLHVLPKLCNLPRHLMSTPYPARDARPPPSRPWPAPETWGAPLPTPGTRCDGARGACGREGSSRGTGWDSQQTSPQISPRTACFTFTKFHVNSVPLTSTSMKNSSTEKIC